MPNQERCFACDRPITGTPRLADTRDDQIVYVGPDCYRQIVATGEDGYQPAKGGPKLYPAPARDTAERPTSISRNVCSTRCSAAALVPDLLHPGP